MSSVDDIIFESIISKPPGTTQGQGIQNQNAGITRYNNNSSIFAEIWRARPKNLYIDLATEIIDHAVINIPSLSDVRNQLNPPQGTIDLTGLVSHYHDGYSEIWISRPYHMIATKFIFSGRFGYVKAARMPNITNNLTTITWYSIDTTTYGQLPAIDLGLLLIKPPERLYRVFINETDAINYYKS